MDRRQRATQVAVAARAACQPGEGFLVVIVGPDGDACTDSNIPTRELAGLLAAMLDARTGTLPGAPR